MLSRRRSGRSWVKGCVLLLGLYAGIKFFLIDFVFKRCPRLRAKYDTPYIVWKSLPTDPQLKERSSAAAVSRRVSARAGREPATAFPRGRRGRVPPAPGPWNRQLRSPSPPACLVSSQLCRRRDLLSQAAPKPRAGGCHGYRESGALGGGCPGRDRSGWVAGSAVPSSEVLAARPAAPDGPPWSLFHSQWRATWAWTLCPEPA